MSASIRNYQRQLDFLNKKAKSSLGAKPRSDASFLATADYAARRLKDLEEILSDPSDPRRARFFASWDDIDLINLSDEFKDYILKILKVPPGVLSKAMEDIK